jgi:hypothetical protein
VTGGGLVVLATPWVKAATLPTSAPALFCTLRAIDAAKSAPGRCGSETAPDPLAEVPLTTGVAG